MRQPQHFLRFLTCFLLLSVGRMAFLPASQAQTVRVLSQDIKVSEQPDRLTFANHKLRLEIDRRTGFLIALTDLQTGDAILSGKALDATVNGTPLLANGSVFQRYTTVFEPYGRGVTLRVAVRPPDGPYELTADYTLFPDEAVLERRASLVLLKKQETRPQLESFDFDVPDIRLGAVADCVVDAPGPFSHRNHVAPAQPLGTLNDTTLTFHSAPEAGFGFLALSNPKQKRTLASWMDTRGEVNYRSRIARRSGRLSFVHPNFRAYYLEPDVAVSSDVHHLELTDALETSLANYRRMVVQTMPPNAQTPAWVREAVILEVYPAYFKGGFREITGRLPFYREVGFNTLYLMPHWLGGYSPVDPFVVDPRYGTEADLKQMVAEAHRLGMRVLFDMVIHGFNGKVPSPVIARHPELFCRTAQGELAQHPTWKSITTDWASPAYQHYMRGLVLHDLNTYGIDGYRVDAAAYKGPNWDPKLPLPGLHERHPRPATDGRYAGRPASHQARRRAAE